MIRARIKIGEGGVHDTFDEHRLIYLSSDSLFEAPVKKRDVSSYPEKAGENIDRRTVQDAFDYKVTFILDAQNRNLDNVNTIIADFNRKLYTQRNNSDVREYKDVTFYNDFKRVRVTGIPEPIAEAKKLYRSKNGYDFAEVEFKIRCNRPQECDFAVREGIGWMAVGSTLRVGGVDKPEKILTDPITKV